MVQAKRKRRRLGARLGLLSGAALIAVVLAELVARLVVPASNFPSPDALDRNLEWAREQEIFEVDAELGFAPRLGTRAYDRFGLIGASPQSAEKQPGRRRYLFLGDSVTRRRTIVGPLSAFVDGDAVELLNAGVESWNPEQEVAFYFRHQRELAADHVVLSLHNNDLTATSLSLLHDGEFVVCSPGSIRAVSPALYRASMLYRMVVHSRFVSRSHPANYTRRAVAVEAALARLRDEVRDRGARLTVLLLPILAGPDGQAAHEQQARTLQLELLERLGIGFLDLQPVCDELVAAGVEVRERADDPWHPSAACGEVLAAAAAGRLFDPGPVEVQAMPRVVRTSQRAVVTFEPEFAGARFRVELAAGLADPAAFAAGPGGRLDDGGAAVVELAVPATAAPPGVWWHRVTAAVDERVATSWPWPMIVPR